MERRTDDDIDPQYNEGMPTLNGVKYVKKLSFFVTGKNVFRVTDFAGNVTTVTFYIKELTIASASQKIKDSPANTRNYEKIRKIMASNLMSGIKVFGNGQIIKYTYQPILKDEKPYLELDATEIALGKKVDSAILAGLVNSGSEEVVSLRGKSYVSLNFIKKNLDKNVFWYNVSTKLKVIGIF